LRVIFILLCSSLFLWSEGLKELIVYAKEHNHQLKALHYGTMAKEKSLSSTKRDYLMPKVVVGGGYRSSSPASPFQAQDTATAYGQISIDLYDGGRLSAQIAQKGSEVEASKFDESYNRKALELSIVNNFFNIQNQKALLASLQEAQRELEAQIDRIEKFYNAKLATVDQVDKIKSAYANNAYQIKATKQQIFALKKELELKVNREIGSLHGVSIVEPSSEELQDSDHILALNEQSKALLHGASALDSAYRPQVTLSDNFTLFSYRNKESNPMIEYLDHQNVISLNVNLQLWDNGVIKEQKQALLVQRQALSEQIDQAKEEQKIKTAIALAQIATAKSKIESSQSALEASQSVYHMIQQKFEAKIVDNVRYLDALTEKSGAEARHQIALNSLEVAKANYYFQLGLDLEEYISE